VVFCENNVFIFRHFFVIAVDFLAFIFTLPKCSDIKVVFKHIRYCDMAPIFTGFDSALLPLSLFAKSYSHARGDDVPIRQVIGDFLVTPTAVI
jgi:hypothetical protein